MCKRGYAVRVSVKNLMTGSLQNGGLYSRPGMTLMHSFAAERPQWSAHVMFSDYEQFAGRAQVQPLATHNLHRKR